MRAAEAADEQASGETTYREHASTTQEIIPGSCVKQFIYTTSAGARILTKFAAMRHTTSSIGV
jgi:hypothetical protein